MHNAAMVANKLLRAFSLLGQDTQPELRNSSKITVQRIFNLRVPGFLRLRRSVRRRGSLSPMTSRQRYSSVNCRARGQTEYNLAKNAARSSSKALHSNNVCWIVSDSRDSQHCQQWHCAYHWHAAASTNTTDPVTFRPRPPSG